MKQISLRLIPVFVLMLMLAGCKGKTEFTAKGVVSGAEGQTLFLENVGVSSIETLDSIKLTATGKFKFKRKRPEYPDFYRLRLNNQLINFAIDSTETVDITADAGTFAQSYSIEGSENCKQMKEITLAQLDANQAINRLRKDFEEKIIPDSTYRKKVLEAANAYKKVALKYIYTKPMSSVAYYALFQQIDGLLFFDLYDRTDLKAYAAVATSFDHFYKDSPRSKHLYNLTLQAIKVMRQQQVSNTLADVKTNEVGFIDIELPDINSTPIKLSSISKGNVIAVNFTAYQTEWSAALNMTLGDLYLKYHNQGFNIYQISLDSDDNFWKNGASNLPWVCVRDPQSVYSQVAGLYNVKKLPAIFLIDKNGNMVKRVDDIKSLENDIKSLL